MEMQQVRYFIAVAKALNFTRAAEECNVTQPALTRAVKLLEHELGGDLIRREGRNTHLTDLGHRMLPMLRQCHEAAMAARMLANAVRKGDISTLSIAVSKTLDPALILAPLREMYAAFMGIQLKLKRGTGSEIAEMLKSGEAELAIGGPLGESWERLEAWPMFTETFDLIVGADHPLTTRDVIDLDVELIGAERFLLHNGAEFTDYEMERLGAAGINVHTAHHVDTDEDIKVLVSAGFGIGIAPSRSSCDPNIQHIDYPVLDMQRMIAIYTVAGRPRSRELNALLNLLRVKDWN